MDKSSQLAPTAVKRTRVGSDRPARISISVDDRMEIITMVPLSDKYRAATLLGLTPFEQLMNIDDTDVNIKVEDVLMNNPVISLIDAVFAKAQPGDITDVCDRYPRSSLLAAYQCMCISRSTYSFQLNMFVNNRVSRMPKVVTSDIVRGIIRHIAECEANHQTAMLLIEMYVRNTTCKS